MPLSMSFYQDQLVAAGQTDVPLTDCHRLIYVRHGTVRANGSELSKDSFTYLDGPVSLEGIDDWSEVWRWELAPPNADPVLLEGTGIHSRARLSRVITTLPVDSGSEWLFRLDSVTSVAGRITPRHQHHGPGIRCLYQGTFNVQDASHLVADQGPGDAWWESGAETVVAWHSRQMPAIFIRALVLPVEFKGEMSNIWFADSPGSKSNWRLFIDQEITV